jgi:hypothetical protein
LSEQGIEEVIRENRHLAHKYELDAGDEVYLHVDKPKEISQKIMRVYGTKI